MHKSLMGWGRRKRMRMMMRLDADKERPPDGGTETPEPPEKLFCFYKNHNTVHEHAG